ncbi:MAG: class I SAM-dependent methyltransferase [Rhodospirillales bacterium]|nr:class I SAM-dependent methyltransferase [Rhodospirillales bacterium]
MDEHRELSIDKPTPPHLAADVIWKYLSEHVHQLMAQALTSGSQFAPLPYTPEQTYQRFRFAMSYYDATLQHILRWVYESVGNDNFTYPLTPRCMQYLAFFVAAVTRKPVDEIRGYLTELDGDQQIRDYYRTVFDLKLSPISPEFNPGRRLGWYAVVRALKPRVVVETGVNAGLGALTLAAAILRNRAEGFPGTYYGTDIWPDAGSLLRDRYAEAGRVLYGDSLQSLAALEETVDLFINDSDHSSEYEAREYRIIEPKLSPGAVILGDNAHATDSLVQFAYATGRQFLFFREEPAEHWYPGGGIGAAFWPG